MAAKKVSKKPTRVVKVPAFNKANAKLFAENIFSDKQGRVTFLKLCDGSLSNGKDGGRTLHCALGEAYFTFVNPNVSKFVRSIERKFGTDLNDNHYLEHGAKRFTPKYSDNHTSNHIPTLAVVDALVDVAQLRSKDPDLKEELAIGLLNAMELNDDICGTDVVDDARRSRDVADVWLAQIVPLLK